MRYNRIFTIVMDSVGVGYMKDDYKYNDEGANTLGHIANEVEYLNIPNLYKLGISNLTDLKGYSKNENTIGYHALMNEISLGKDTMTGHYEIMGLNVEKPFITFTENGFPDELIKELEDKSGHKFIGNKSASGTEILEELGKIHIDTKALILYTSADSVLQIAACESIIPLEELYRICEIAREITLKPEWKVGRVIARPFIITDNGYERTPNRHDYALKPFSKTTLDYLKEEGYDVISVGKIYDIFDTEGLTESNKSKSSVHGMQQTLEIADRNFKGLCFVNLVDFDAKWGHRRNPVGYAKELEDFDVSLGMMLDKLKDDDLLIVTADHGNDPTWHGTDHTREKVPFLAYSPSMKNSAMLKESNTFANIAETISENFNVESTKLGTSYLKDLI